MARTVAFEDKRARLCNRYVAVLRLLLMVSPGKVVPYGRLETALDPQNRIADIRAQIRLRVCGIRRAFQDAEIPIQIRTVYGSGLVLETEIVQPDAPSVITLTPEAVRLVKRLIEKCPSELLAEQARRAVFGS